MPTYQEYQQEFVGYVVNGSSTPGMLPSLQTLLDALPYYGDPDFESAHRDTLSQVLQLNMANDPIAPQPDQSGPGYSVTYVYQGHDGYADAFFHAKAPSLAVAAVEAGVRAQNGQLNPGWWQKYALAVVTDAAQQAASVPVDTGKLAGDLSSLNSAFLPALTASYLAVFRFAFDPTVAALGDISDIGQACSDLTTALGDAQFTANINAAISMGGDSTSAAVWFLYNLWVTLAALSCSNVDGEIEALRSGGLNVPGEVGPQSWWNGGYTTWYSPLAGPDVVQAAAGIFTEDMPEEMVSSISADPPVPPTYSNITMTNGYSQSLCLWGPLNAYALPSKSVTQ
jgi:hypothetical protein